MTDVKDVKVMDTKPSDVYLYDWDSEDSVKRIKNRGIILSDDVDLTRYRRWMFDVNYNGIRDMLFNASGTLQMIRVNLRDAMKDEAASDCILEKVHTQGLALTSKKGKTCVIKPKYIQTSKIFTKKWLFKNYQQDRKKIVLKIKQLSDE